MKSTLIPLLTHAAGLSFVATLAAAQDTAEPPILTVYTYDSFVTEWGPGPVIEEAFEVTCGCDVQFVSTGDGAALLARVALEGTRTDADVVLGLDTNLTASAEATGLFAPNGVSTLLDLPVSYDNPLFLPYDWGYFAFVGNAGEPMAQSFEDLADSDISIVIQDPRSSTPGLGLVLWVQAVYGDRAADIWERLADNIVTVTPGWSEAYGLFLEGEADAVLSYTTSPAYHIIAEGDDTKVAWPFEEGHYMQIEVAAKLGTTDQSDLADAFLAFLLTPDIQGLIATTNWMYPVVMPEDGLPAGFDALISPDKAILMSDIEARDARSAAIATWRAALSQ